jgi:hypothetical protein
MGEFASVERLETTSGANSLDVQGWNSRHPMSLVVYWVLPSSQYDMQVWMSFRSTFNCVERSRHVL